MNRTIVGLKDVPSHSRADQIREFESNYSRIERYVFAPFVSVISMFESNYSRIERLNLNYMIPT